MRPKIILQILIPMIAAGMLSAQSVSPSVIAGAGTSFTGSSHQIQWTAGEVSVASYATASLLLSQGFHQPKLIITSLSGPVSQNMEVRYWPNPTVSVLQVEVLNSGPSLTLFSLCDLRGKVLYTRSISENEIAEIDLRGLTASYYLLRVNNSDNQFYTAYKIQKIH